MKTKIGAFFPKARCDITTLLATFHSTGSNYWLMICKTDQWKENSRSLIKKKRVERFLQMRQHGEIKIDTVDDLRNEMIEKGLSRSNS